MSLAALLAPLVVTVTGAGQCIVAAQPPAASGEPLAVVAMPFGGARCSVPFPLPPGSASPFVLVDDTGVAQAALAANRISLTMPLDSGATIVRVEATLSPGADPVEVWQATVTKDAFP